eukprot:13720147-Alexandrium_andersonii.AAC.1
MGSVLLVPATQPAKLEDMSLGEPSRWLRTHSVWCKGKHITRQEGGKVAVSYTHLTLPTICSV